MKRHAISGYAVIVAAIIFVALCTYVYNSKELSSDPMDQSERLWSIYTSSDITDMCEVMDGSVAVLAGNSIFVVDVRGDEVLCTLPSYGCEKLLGACEDSEGFVVYAGGKDSVRKITSSGVSDVYDGGFDYAKVSGDMLYICSDGKFFSVKDGKNKDIYVLSKHEKVVGYDEEKEVIYMCTEGANGLTFSDLCAYSLESGEYKRVICDDGFLYREDDDKLYAYGKAIDRSVRAGDGKCYNIYVTYDGKACVYEDGHEVMTMVGPLCVYANGSVLYKKSDVTSLGVDDFFVATSVELSPEFTDIRKRADEIEGKYGIKIAIGDEVNTLPPEGHCLFDSSQGSSRYDERTRYLYHMSALDMIDDVLSMYPEGFLDKFKNKLSEGGLVIGLCDRVYDPNDKVGTTYAVAYKTGSNYYLVADILYADHRELINHELWHCVEYRICEDYEDAFTMKEFGKLNPEGFRYSKGIWNDKKNVFRASTIEEWDGKSDVYFVRDYSFGTSKEDRATIIERLLSERKIKENYDEICSYKGLKCKLEYMKEKTERVWGYCYWEEMLKKELTNGLE